MENYLDIVDFALTAMFIYMIVMQIRNKLTILVSFISGVIAIVALVTLKSTMGLIVATLLASFIGFMIEHNIVKKGEAKGNFWLKKIKPKASRMKYVPVSLFTALVVRDLFVNTKTYTFVGLEYMAKLLAAIIVIVVAYRSRSMGLSVLFGLVAVAILATFLTV